MGWLALLSGMVALTGLGAAGIVVATRRRRVALLDASAELSGYGLTHAGGTTWTGTASGRAVEVHAPRPGLLGIRVCCEGSRTGSARRRDPGEAPRPGTLHTGDHALDATVHLDGEPATWLVLDEDARVALRKAVHAGVTVSEGAISAVVTRASAGTTLQRAIHLAQLLEPPPDVSERLLERLREDTDPQVRLRILRHLLAGPVAADAAAAAMSDRIPAVRLVAAHHLGDGAGLLALLLDLDVPAAIRDEAFLTLSHSRRDVLERGLLAEVERPPRSARAALHRMAALADPALSRALLPLIAALRDDTDRARAIGPAALQALDAAPVPEAEDAVLDLLDSTAARALLAPSLALLRQVGTTTSIARLDALATARPDLAAAVQETRAAIAVGVWGAELAAALDLDWDPAQRCGRLDLEGLPAEVRLDPTHATLRVMELPSNLAVVPRPHTLEPLCEDPVHQRFRVAEPAQVLALLTPAVREALLNLTEGGVGFSMRSGRLHLRLALDRPPAILDRVRRLRSFLAALQSTSDLPPTPRMASAWRLETDILLRRRLLTGLIEASEPSVDVDGVARVALDSDDAHQARAAAVHLGRADILTGIVRDRTAPSSVRSAALRDLAKVSPDELPASLTWALEDLALLHAALGLVADRHLTEHAPAVGAWVDRLAPPGSPPERLVDEPLRSVLGVLCHLEASAAEAWIVRALAAPDGDLRRRAIGALGACGGALALAALRDHSQRGWSLGPEATAVRTAIATIRGRAGARGGLSVAASESGRVSLAEPRGGQLSAIEDDA